MAIFDKLEIIQGTDFTWSWILKENGTPVDLSAYEGIFQIRNKPAIHTDSELFVDCASYDSIDGELTFNADGEITIILPASLTNSIAADIVASDMPLGYQSQRLLFEIKYRSGPTAVLNSVGIGRVDFYYSITDFYEEPV